MEDPHEKIVIQYKSTLFSINKEIYSIKKGLANYLFDEIASRKNFEKVPYLENFIRDKETGLYLKYRSSDLENFIKFCYGINTRPSNVNEKILLASHNKKDLESQKVNNLVSKIQEDFEKIKKKYPESVVDPELIKKIEKENEQLSGSDIVVGW